MRRPDAGFTLMEVLVAFAIVGIAFVALVGQQTQSLSSMERLTRRFEVDLWLHDAYTRFQLNQMGYQLEEIHPLLGERHPEWEVEVEEEPLDPDDLPVMVPFPVNWQVTWVNVRIVGDGSGGFGAEGDGNIGAIRPLWARNPQQFAVDADENVINLRGGAKDDDEEAEEGERKQGKQEPPPQGGAR